MAFFFVSKTEAKVLPIMVADFVWCVAHLLNVCLVLIGKIRVDIGIIIIFLGDSK